MHRPNASSKCIVQMHRPNASSFSSLGLATRAYFRTDEPSRLALSYPVSATPHSSRGGRQLSMEGKALSITHYRTSMDIIARPACYTPTFRFKGSR